MFLHAPAPAAVDGLVAVPVHIVRLTARVVLDARTCTGRVQAVVRYRVGAAAGCPIFDLRQPVDAVWLDGHPIAPERVRPRLVGEGPYATVRVVDLPQAAGSTHTLRLHYRLTRPCSDLRGAAPPGLSARGRRRLRWSFGMADLFDGRHLEMWFPSNLPFDRFPFVLQVGLVGVDSEHVLITNGATTAIGTSSWRVAFPAWFSSLSPMLELWPSDEVDHLRGQVALGRSGRTLPVDLWKVKGGPEDLAYEGERIGRLLEANESVFGPFPLERYTCFFQDRDGGMEYAGATTTSSGALAHEVLHSWFARGVMPASDADGWWDEAFTTYVTGGAAPLPLDFRRPPVRLCSRRSLQRHTAAASYGEGGRLFGGLAAHVGRETLLRAMGALYRARRCTTLSTAELEEHLVLDTGAVGIVDAFHRFVYGFDDPRQGSGVRFDRLAVVDGPDGRLWIDAQVSNDRDAAVCRHFLLLFSTAPRAGAPAGVRAAAAQVLLPAPPDAVSANVAAVAGFDLQPGRSRVVRVPVPRDLVWPDAGVGDAEAVVGAVHARLAHPSGGPLDLQERTRMRAPLGRRSGWFARSVAPGLRPAGDPIGPVRGPGSVG